MYRQTAADNLLQYSQGPESLENHSLMHPLFFVKHVAVLPENHTHTTLELAAKKRRPRKRLGAELNDRYFPRFQPSQQGGQGLAG